MVGGCARENELDHSLLGCAHAFRTWKNCGFVCKNKLNYFVRKFQFLRLCCLINFLSLMIIVSFICYIVIIFFA